MKSEIGTSLQTIVIYKINPNKQEREGDVTFDRNVDGRIFRNCKIFIVIDSMVIESIEGIVEGVFSLQHYYLLEYGD